MKKRWKKSAAHSGGEGVVVGGRAVVPCVEDFVVVGGWAVVPFVEDLVVVGG